MLLKYADWDMLVRLLSGEPITDDNLFTWSLYRSIMNDSHLHQPVGVLMHETPDAYVCADTLKDWFEAQINAWIDASAISRVDTISRWFSGTTDRFVLAWWEATRRRPGTHQARKLDLPAFPAPATLQEPRARLSCREPPGSGSPGGL